MRRNNMGKKYLDTKTYTLEASVMDVWENLEEEEQNFEAIVREGMKKLDPVGQADGDIDNDGDEDETDAYLKNRRKAIGRAMKGKKNLKANYGMMRANYGMGEDVDLDEGTKQVLAHGGKGQYKAVRDGGITKIMYKGKVVGTADFDSGADSFFVSMKGVKGQKSFDDAQAMVDYFAKNKITEGSKEEYEKFFNAAMKKFKINSPADLKSDEEKKKFFDYVDKNYTGEKNEGAMKRGKDMDTFKPKPKKEKVGLDEKPADFIRLSFNSPADVKKARKWMDQNLPGANQGFTGVDYSGKDIEFEDVDDAEDLMSKLKKAGFKFKVDFREGFQKQHEFKMQSMKNAVRKVWEASDREKIENKREKSVKAEPGKTMTGDDMSVIKINPQIKG